MTPGTTPRPGGPDDGTLGCDYHRQIAATGHVPVVFCTP
ncbi:hypothetical protein C8E95_0951 [Pseudonocardia autotrophica]|uniref:Uncharacterized protein n=1 Tax=Pseudonocardia autotrophica TaxID=2074 RepID=A0A1Y2N0Y7_PSEAH|nr:hypothetical protein BG845_02535 [Pseudonocardia autotrophica]TDN71916.1 hypothetical protein C8E95_0951 [Pseudonocardia autotrophica]